MPFTTRIDNQQEIKIHYKVIGKGEPVIFHHGNGNRIDDWHSLGYVDALSNDFQLILIDSRGYGKSSKPHDPTAYNLASRAADTISVLDELNIAKAHCFGGSIGGAICMILAKHYPQRFKSFILATPYFTQFDASFKPAMLAGAESFLVALEKLFGRFGNDAIRKTFLANDGKALWAANSSEWFNYLDYAALIKVPALIYVGAKEPTVKDLTELSKKISHCKLHIFPNIDHAELYWSGKLVAPVIRDFLKSL